MPQTKGRVGWPWTTTLMKQTEQKQSIYENESISQAWEKPNFVAMSEGKQKMLLKTTIQETKLRSAQNCQKKKKVFLMFSVHTTSGKLQSEFTEQGWLQLVTKGKVKKQKGHYLVVHATAKNLACCHVVEVDRPWYSYPAIECPVGVSEQVANSCQMTLQRSDSVCRPVMNFALVLSSDLLSKSTGACGWN